MTYLIQYELDGQWFTCARRKSFKAACSKARSEGRAMKWAHMTSIIKDGDPEILRRRAEDNFELSDFRALTVQEGAALDAFTWEELKS